MRKILSLSFFLLAVGASAQQHFAGINTSSRVGFINNGINPAELANVNSRYTFNVIAPSVVASTNKVGLNDLLDGDELGDKLFSGTENTQLKIDSEIVGPGFAYKMDKWVLGISTRAFARLDVVDVDPKIGDAIVNSRADALNLVTAIQNDANQRVNGTTWGEIGFTAAHTILDNEQHSINVGATMKLLFPGSYANFGANGLEGTITFAGGDAYLNNTNAMVNIAYSGNLGEDFTEVNDYFTSLYGQLNGIAADIGINYRLKDNAGNQGYRLNAGVSLRNLGTLTFKNSNNYSSDYILEINEADPTQGLNLDQFEGVTSLSEIEQILLQSGHLQGTRTRRDFKASLPTLFILYADVRIIPDFFITGYTQQKMRKDQRNNQIANENVTSVIPRYVYNNLEAFVPFNFNEISGFSLGFGFRAYGFFAGSSALFTSLSNDSNHADFYIGYGFSL